VPHLLHLDSAASLHSSRSREITATFADTWRAQGPQFTVTYRDLHRDPLPHLADAVLHWPPRLRPDGAAAADPAALAAAEALQDELVAELLAADVLLVGAPLYNYSVPSSLKTWIDHIHIPGRTAPFVGVPDQPLAGRPAVVVSSRGASYDAGSPTEGWDHAVPVLELILGASLGMNVEVITTSLTLAETVPALAPQLGRARGELAAAHEAAAAAASRLAAPRVVSVSREIAASPERIFELIADPAQQPRWDGNDNLAEAAEGQRVRQVGDVFAMTLTKDAAVRHNHVVEFEEGRRIAWRPSPPGEEQPGHLWRWELQPLDGPVNGPVDGARTLVTHTYDWTRLTDSNRLQRARQTTADKLMASMDLLAALAESR
jgi:FMN-dependent NADH-azoreductase